MHIGLVIYGSLDTLSGGYLYDRKLVEHLRRRGDSVEIVSLPRRSYARSLAGNLSSGLLERLAAGRFDLVLQDELNHPSLFHINTRLRRRSPVRLVSIVHHLRRCEQRPAWQNRLYAWVEDRYLRSVDGFIFNSRTTRDAVAAAGRGPASRPSVIAYPGGDRFESAVTPDEIEARAFEPGPLRILFVGNLIPRKGLMTLVDALALLPGCCTLTVVGEMKADPAHTRRVQARIRRLGLDERVRLCGRLAEPELAAALRRSQVLAVPSTYEGFGIVYLEGMGFGLPAVATSQGAAVELIEDGKTGYTVTPNDPHALAHALGKLNSDRGLLAETGRAALNRFRAHPAWEDSAAQIRSFLIDFIAG